MESTPKIAIITSTLSPKNFAIGSDTALSSFSISDRIAQTHDTIKSLQSTGIKNIFLCDNSVDPIVHGLFLEPEIVAIHRPASFQFNNKGINECLLLLSSLDELPDAGKTIKISGRYKANKVHHLPATGWDIAAKPSPYRNPKAISTRFYVAFDKESLRIFAQLCLREMFAYSCRISGSRSFVNIFKNQFKPDYGFPFESPFLMLEQAACNILTNPRSRLLPMWLDNLGVSGTIANPNYPGFIINE